MEVPDFDFVQGVIFNVCNNMMIPCVEDLIMGIRVYYFIMIISARKKRRENSDIYFRRTSTCTCT